MTPWPPPRPPSAVLMGAVGGPKWKDGVPRDKRPEAGLLAICAPA